MSTTQSSAALTGALLANKGAAAPSNSVSAILEEFPAAQQPMAAAPTVVPVRREEAVDAKNGSSEPPLQSGEAETKSRAKLSLRLDPERHLRLKLAAAHLRRSSQAIMLDALDAYLSTVTTAIDGTCQCLGDDA